MLCTFKNRNLATAQQTLHHPKQDSGNGKISFYIQMGLVLLLAMQGLLRKPAIEPDAPFPELDCYGGKATPGSPYMVSTNGVVLIPILELKGDSFEGIHHPWICISMSH